MPATHGYSGKPLVAKLGIRPGDRVKTRRAPEEYREMLAPLPEGVVLSARLRPPVDVVHLFAGRRAELARWLPGAVEAIRPAGMIWVSWPKKSSGVASDLDENGVRELAFPLGLVDVKVCAVDATWSGLKLVIRTELRQS